MSISPKSCASGLASHLGSDTGVSGGRAEMIQVSSPGRLVWGKEGVSSSMGSSGSEFGGARKARKVERRGGSISDLR